MLWAGEGTDDGRIFEASTSEGSVNRPAGSWLSRATAESLKTYAWAKYDLVVVQSDKNISRLLY